MSVTLDWTGHSPKEILVRAVVGGAGTVYSASGLPWDTIVAIATVVYLVVSTIGVAPKAWATLKIIWKKWHPPQPENDGQD